MGKIIPNHPDHHWSEFIAQDLNANIFHHPAWLEVLADCYGYRSFIIGEIDTDGEYHAGIPIMEVKSLITGHRWISLPFSDHCQPLFRDAASLRRLTDKLFLLSEQGTAPRIELRGSFSDHPHIYTHSSYVCHTLQLQSQADKMMDQFHPMHRRNIRLARDRGVSIQRGSDQEHLHEFYRLHLETRRQQGIPVQPKKFFELLKKHVIESELGFILLAYFNEQCIAAAVFLHFQQVLTYKYGASHPDMLDKRPNNLLMWAGIRWGCEHGFGMLDLGRTSISNTGLRAYKSRWGAEETPLVYSSFSNQSLSPSTGKKMSLMQFIVKNSPSVVCRLMGEILYKHYA